MNPSDELFDDRIADWLEEDPVLAPAQVLETVRAALPSVPQRRPLPLPWQLGPAIRFGLAAAAIVVVIVLGATVLGPFRGGIGAHPTASPSGSPTPGPTAREQQPTSGLVTYTSAIYGYSIDYPTEWQVQVATRSLTAIEIPWGTSAGIDDFEQGTDGQGGPSGALFVATPDIGSAFTLDAWTARTAYSVCSTPATDEAIEVAGEPARMLTYPSCNGLFHLWVTVVQGTTGAHIIWLDDAGREAADRAIFEDILDTFSFPPDARTSPVPSATP
jgi:hypothetical protein